MSGWLQSIANKIKGDVSQQADAKSSALKDHPTTVLVIDDDYEFLAAIQELLSAQGFNVLTASSGAKGLNILFNGPKDLRVVLLDYRMPDFTGLDTLHHIHNVQRDIKVIAITGTSQAELPDEFRNGVDKLISKPFKIADLVALITEQARLHATAPSHRTPRVTSPPPPPPAPKLHPDIQM